jgi:wobble nucleotide-excising tRNase
MVRHSETIRELREEEAGLRQVEGDPKPSAENLTRNVAQLLGRNELTFRVIDGGRYAVLRRERPAVGLSTGERTAISLVHFLEEVARADRAGGHPIVVIDDPISSLDSNVFLGVSTLIWSEMVTKEHAAQLFLFTHNFELFRQWDVQLDGIRRGALQARFPSAMYELRSAHRGSVDGPVRRARFTTWPPSERHRKRVRSAYHHGFIAVSDAYLALKQDDSLEKRLDAQLLFPNVIRRLLETFLAFKRPESASDFTGSMRDSAAMLREAGYVGDADALRTRLTRYAHAFSHDESPETGRTVEPDEIAGAMLATFEFMQALDPPHFAGLCEVIDQDPAELLPNPPGPVTDGA